MKWRDGRRSTNVEDRRGRSSGGLGGGGGFPPMMMGGGIGGILLMLLLYFLTSGLGGGSIGPNSGITNQDPQVTQTQQDDLYEFTSVVLAYTEDIWKEQFKAVGQTYVNPQLVVFTDAVNSGCGYQSSQVGPFYCPADQKIYIDLGFFSQMQSQLGAGGDFAMAYVIAHEVGHHVQNQLGITDQVMGLRNRLSEKDFNQYMVRLELQADYFAGVWAHYVERANLLDIGDFEEALNAASAVGDDRIQSEAWGYVVPDKFTHGTSEQRARWFNKGFELGTMRDGDTFNTSDL